MAKKKVADMRSGMLYCPGCDKAKYPSDFCFHCGQCSKCCEHVICEHCNALYPKKSDWTVAQTKKKLHPICSNCGGCCECCVCQPCQSCGVESIGKYGLCQCCRRCWKCCVGISLVRKSMKKSTNYYIEPWLMNFYALSELQAELIRTENDEEFRVKKGIDLAEVKELKSNVEKEFSRYSELLAKKYLDYLFSACIGEMRHLCRRSACRIGMGTCGGSNDRDACIQTAVKYRPEAALIAMAIGFCSTSFNNGFGGKKWSEICEAGLMYFDPKVSRQVFLDHVVDLSHNGGLYLGKTTRFFSYYNGVYLGVLDNKKKFGVFKSLMPLFINENTKDFIKLATSMKVIPGVKSEIETGNVNPGGETITFGEELIKITRTPKHTPMYGENFFAALKELNITKFLEYETRLKGLILKSDFEGKNVKPLKVTKILKGSQDLAESK